jgi:hypothetical protein
MFRCRLELRCRILTVCSCGCGMPFVEDGWQTAVVPIPAFHMGEPPVLPLED